MSLMTLRVSAGIPAGLRAAIVVAFLWPALETGAFAQTDADKGGFAVRELSLSIGYGSVRLPPITLGGYLPPDALHEDVITSGTAAIDWRRVTARTRYTFDLLGTYTARARFSRLSAPGADLKFEVTHAPGTRWRLGAGVANAIVSSDMTALQPMQARRLAEDAASFEDPAGARVSWRSPSPDAAHAALFVPISQPVVPSELAGTRIIIAGARAEATYLHSVKLATRFHGSYTTVRPMGPKHDGAQALWLSDSSGESAGLGIGYRRSERTRLTADLIWSRTSGVSTDEAVSATAGYAWSGRKWFTLITGGAALRPFTTPSAAAPATTTRRRPPTFIYSAAAGYRFRTQTLLVHYSREAHDEYGHGGLNVATGFEGNVQSVVGTWSWWAPRGNWLARSDFSMIRRPGNFSYIYAWLSTASVGRQLGPNVRLMGEVLFDRHGSRGFEGFHLTRERARVTLVWTPSRRRVGSSDSDQ